MKYIVTYDLNNSGKNYEGLIGAIKKMDYCPLLKSAWLVKTSSSATSIYNSLAPFFDKDDRILVAEINSNHMGFLSADAVAFLR